MKILCLIDSLGPGGAQRQLSTLATLLKKRGHELRFLVYHPDIHFYATLQGAEIPCYTLPPCKHLSRLMQIRRLLRAGWQDVVLAFLEAPSLYAEIASLPRRRWGLVVGERLASPRIKSVSSWWLRQGHRFADAVVTNSHTNRLMLNERWPFMRKKLTTIYNTVDMSLFHENGGVSTTGAIPETNAFRIVVAASYHEKKNMLNVARSLLLLKNEGVSNRVIVDWYGADQPDGRPLEKARQFVAENNLENHLRFHNSTRIIHLEYARCDAVGLFSLFEGLPNAVCEGMASGKPIIISNVCDAGNLVRDGRNGFLVEPTCPRSIADGIKRLVSMSSQQRTKMGIESRKMAAELFNEDAIAARYEEVLIAALHRRNPSPHCMWPDKVPDSAIRSALALQN